MNPKRKEKMTTIKVTPEVGAIVSVAVKMIKTKGDKEMTASKLLYNAMKEMHPDAVKFIEGEVSFEEDAENEDAEE